MVYPGLPAHHDTMLIQRMVHAEPAHVQYGTSMHCGQTGPNLNQPFLQVRRCGTILADVEPFVAFKYTRGPFTDVSRVPPIDHDMYSISVRTSCIQDYLLFFMDPESRYKQRNTSQGLVNYVHVRV